VSVSRINLEELREEAERARAFEGGPIPIAEVEAPEVLALVEAVEAAMEQLPAGASPRWSKALARFSVPASETEK
jgi:hypothetical protein